MLIYFLLLFSALLQLINSSFHSLVLLLTIELFVLTLLFSYSYFCFSLFIPYMILLIGVCVGAFGVSLFVSLSQGGGPSYVKSFLP